LRRWRADVGRIAVSVRVQLVGVEGGGVHTSKVGHWIRLPATEGREARRPSAEQTLRLRFCMREAAPYPARTPPPLQAKVVESSVVVVQISDSLPPIWRQRG
jgi:hypothetical protein